MKPYLVLSMLFAVACSVQTSQSHSRPDCGLCGMEPPLCTTIACAQSPCTAGCAFVSSRGFNECPSASPALVATSAVRACPGFCGRFTDANAVGCGVYDSTIPGCQACGARAGDPSCVVVSPMLDYLEGGAICQAPAACFNGVASRDAGVQCDLSPHD